MYYIEQNQGAGPLSIKALTGAGFRFLQALSYPAPAQDQLLLAMKVCRN